METVPRKVRRKCFRDNLQRYRKVLQEKASALGDEARALKTTLVEKEGESEQLQSSRGGTAWSTAKAIPSSTCMGIHGPSVLRNLSSNVEPYH